MKQQISSQIISIRNNFKQNALIKEKKQTNKNSINDYCNTIVSVDTGQFNYHPIFSNQQHQKQQSRAILYQLNINNLPLKQSKQCQIIKSNHKQLQLQYLQQNLGQKIMKLEKKGIPNQYRLLQRIQRIKKIISQNIELRNNIFERINVNQLHTQRKTVLPEKNTESFTKTKRQAQKFAQTNQKQQQKLNQVHHNINFLNKRQTGKILHIFNHSSSQLQSFLIKILLLDTQLLNLLDLFPVQFKELMSSFTHKEAQQIYPLAKYINSIISTSKKHIKDDDVMKRTSISTVYENWKQQAMRYLILANNQWNKRKSIDEYKSIILKHGSSQIVQILKKIVRENKIQIDFMMLQIMQFRVKNDFILLKTNNWSI